jgi:hypothetical protein
VVVCGRGSQPCVVVIFSGLCNSVEEEEGCLATGPIERCCSAGK